MKISQNITKVILVLGIILYALKLVGIIDLSWLYISSWFFMVYGFAAVVVTLGTQRRAFLFVSTIIFMLGIVLYVSTEYLFLNPKALIFPSSLFIIGAGFLILFINDIANKVFLYSSGLLIIFALLSVWFTKSFGIMKFINALSFLIIDYSPVFLILIGISILMNRKKNNH